jgi:Hint module
LRKEKLIKYYCPERKTKQIRQNEEQAETNNHERTMMHVQRNPSIRRAIFFLVWYLSLILQLYPSWNVRVNGQSLNGRPIITNRAIYEYNESITILWNYTDVGKGDWIGIYPSNIRESFPTTYIMWVYVRSENQTLLVGTQESGSVTFDANPPYEGGSQDWPLAEGSYKVHILRLENSPYSAVESSGIFQVKPIRSPTPPLRPSAIRPSSAPSPSVCFSALNTVEVKDVGVMPMNQLKIGDYVKRSNSDNDDDAYTQVYGFGHLDHNREDEFLQIFLDHSNTSSDNNANSLQHLPPFEVTSRHLVFVKRNDKEYTIAASNIRIGDEVLLHDKRQQQHHRCVVQSIHTVKRQGVYSPLTQSGDMVVSGLRVSNYVDVLDVNLVLWDQHKIGHALFFPQRLFCTHFLETCKKETYRKGYGLWSYLIVGIGSSLNEYGWWTRYILALFCIPVVGIVYVMESLGSYRLWNFLVIVPTLWIVRKRNNKKY